MINFLSSSGNNDGPGNEKLTLVSHVENPNYSGNHYQY